MSDHIYKILELTGTSSKSCDDAINTAIARASKTVRGMKWFQVMESRGMIENGKASQFQVTIKIGFTLDEK
ncbi:MAG: dodecin domain-containing protein [Phycisphaerae bacterium]|nr:dodecin domain-containing protein [Phycisphaerae bacterium]